MIIEDIASQSGGVLKSLYDWKNTIFGVYVYPGSVETLGRRGGITNHRSIASSPSNIWAKNYQNQLMCVEVIVRYIIVVFWDTVYTKVKSKLQKLSTCGKVIRLWNLYNLIFLSFKFSKFIIKYIWDAYRPTYIMALCGCDVTCIEDSWWRSENEDKTEGNDWSSQELCCLMSPTTCSSFKISWNLHEDPHTTQRIRSRTRC